MPAAELRRRLRHDLRSPLAIVVGYADLLRSGVHGGLNADQLRSVDAILEAADRLRRDLDALADALPTDEERERS